MGEPKDKHQLRAISPFAGLSAAASLNLAVQPQLQQSWLCCVLCLIERIKQQGELDNSVACSALAAARPHWILLSMQHDTRIFQVHRIRSNSVCDEGDNPSEPRTDGIASVLHEQAGYEERI